MHRFKALLTALLIFLKETHCGIEINHVATDIGSDCGSVCASLTLQCYDNVQEEMNCKSAAEQICGTKSVSDASGSLHCDVGGCYVDCSSAVYASRGTHYWTCNTQPICHHTVGGQNPNYYSYSQICSCAIVTEDEPELHVYIYQMVGIGLFFCCLAAIAAQIFSILFPSLFPTK